MSSEASTFSQPVHDEGEARGARMQDVLQLRQAVLSRERVALRSGVFCRTHKGLC